jgi:hypothetical protein
MCVTVLKTHKDQSIILLWLDKNFPLILTIIEMTFEFEYLSEFEFIFENNLEYESGGREGTFDEKKQNWKIRCKCTVLYLKGTVQRDFLPPFFSQIDFSQAPYSVFKDFSNLASNSKRYSRFLIDSPLLFIAESRYSPYCLIRRVATLRFIIAGSHYLLELSA